MTAASDAASSFNRSQKVPTDDTAERLSHNAGRSGGVRRQLTRAQLLLLAADVTLGVVLAAAWLCH